MKELPWRARGTSRMTAFHDTKGYLFIRGYKYGFYILWPLGSFTINLVSLKTFRCSIFNKQKNGRGFFLSPVFCWDSNENSGLYFYYF